MAKLKVLVDSGVHELDGTIHGDVVAVPVAVVGDVLGWDLRPEGLCRNNVCVPLPNRDDVVHDDRIDLVAVAHLTGSQTLIDQDASTIAISVPTQSRRQTLIGKQAADFALPDLDGEMHSLSEFAGKRRLLVAFATW